ncbi:arrestin domain-containing protein 2-like [Corticium candelabrum]|uniref:arrestin domain-containing protein 2-like n=1 Tax=Corticium candelabrum TaxID=121492 RepID=UPI002E26362C|nr:arrestin domain-containing protein 2-like [Corticium candelabrum]
MARRLRIQLLHGRKVYHPGQALVGTVIIQLRDSIIAHAVHLTVHGMSLASVADVHSSNYNENVTHINHRIDLWTAFDDITVLPMGHHSFHFSYCLPLQLPSSIEFHESSSFITSKVGTIRYWLTATVNRPRHFNLQTKLPFTVIEYIDVNDASLLHSMMSENEKTLCCCCCASGPLVLTASVDRMGYCPGEKATISTIAENVGNRRVTGLRARLIAATTLSLTLKETTSLTTVSVLEERPIPPRHTIMWQQKKLTIPPLPPTNLKCRMISRDYYIQVELIVAKGINLETYFPIVVGSVPFKQTSEIKKTICIDSTVPKESRQRWPIPLTSSVPTTVPQLTVWNNPLVDMAGNDQGTYGSMQWVYCTNQHLRTTPHTQDT